ncbi:hypothetical protein CLU79DRAFT_741740 [Phycomyces nitens]|nr:hypothetical protein CLU79DRAFT_741740 [Phycomyces nitens]
MSDIVIPSQYGYVLGTAVASVLLLISLTIKVGGARKAAGIPYPYAYAEKAEAEKDPKKNIFNCTQRAHQNTLESFPIFMTLLLIGGISHPIVAASSGTVWLIGRFIYAKGYSSGQPDKRIPGATAQLSLLANLAASVHTVYRLIA